MAKYRIEFDEEDCIGCGTCNAVCEENWEMDYEKNKARPKKTELEEVGCNQDAADNCPANCIRVVKVEDSPE
ncbi:ferredoxin [Candidatus Woesearchaeota archaeon]|nr:MAG: ferredoxin [Candidatus Woesearchaeota archaeon]